MFAVTESLSTSLTDVLFPTADDPSQFPSRLRESTSHADSRWFPSARIAMRYALLDAGLTPEDEVLVPAYTCRAVKRAVESVATPVYVDVTNQYTIDVREAERKISEQTSAIVPIHLYGIECEMSAVEALAEQYDLTIIEDAAQALSNLVLSSNVGTASDYTVLSFRFYKEATAFKGGLLLSGHFDTEPTSMESSSKRWKMVAIWTLDGMLGRLPGRVYQRLRRRVLDPLSRSASAVERTAPQVPSSWTRRFVATQLAELHARVESRRRNAAVYDDELPVPFVQPPSSGSATIFRYPVLVPASHRDTLCQELRKRGIGVSTMYSYTIAPNGTCPVAEDIARRMLNLPVHSELSEADVSSIATTVRESWQRVQ